MKTHTGSQQEEDGGAEPPPSAEFKTQLGPFEGHPFTLCPRAGCFNKPGTKPSASCGGILCALSKTECFLGAQPRDKRHGDQELVRELAGKQILHAC